MILTYSFSYLHEEYCPIKFKYQLNLLCLIKIIFGCGKYERENSNRKYICSTFDAVNAGDIKHTCTTHTNCGKGGNN